MLRKRVIPYCFKWLQQEHIPNSDVDFRCLKELCVFLYIKIFGAYYETRNRAYCTCS